MNEEPNELVRIVAITIIKKQKEPESYQTIITGIGVKDLEDSSLLDSRCNLIEFIEKFLTISPARVIVMSRTLWQETRLVRKGKMRKDYYDFKFIKNHGK